MVVHSRSEIRDDFERPSIGGTEHLQHPDLPFQIRFLVMARHPGIGDGPSGIRLATALKLWRTFSSSRALSTPSPNAVLAAPCAPPVRSSTSLASERPPSPPPNHCWRCSPISLLAVPPAPPPPLPACSSLQPTCGIEPIPSSASSVSLSTCTAPFPNSPAVHKSLLTASEGVEDVPPGAEFGLLTLFFSGFATLRPASPGSVGRLPSAGRVCPVPGPRGGAAMPIRDVSPSEF